VALVVKEDLETMAQADSMAECLGSSEVAELDTCQSSCLSLREPC
jgi:hypothetical protein